ncbi:Uncharacterized protein QTN25_004677 [Entamoeba marina]
MTTLELPFLANVLLYIDSIQDMINLLLVNKKCREAPLMLRTNPQLNRRLNKDTCPFDLVKTYRKELNGRFEIRSLQIFSKIKTVALTGDELEYYKSDIKHIPQIALRSLPCPDNLSLFQGCIVEFNGEIKNPINMSVFTKLRICRLTLLEDIPLIKIFPNKKQKLDLLRLSINFIYKSTNLCQLEQFRDFSKKIVQIDKQSIANANKILATPLIHSFATVVHNIPFFRSPNALYLGITISIPYDTFQPLQQFIIQEMEQKHIHDIYLEYPRKYNTDVILDLREMSQIHSISSTRLPVLSPDTLQQISPNQWKNINTFKKNSLHVFNETDTFVIPSTVTSLVSYDSNPSWDTTLNIIKGHFKNGIPDLIFEATRLTKLHIKNCDIDDSFEPFTSIVDLKFSFCSYSGSPQSIYPTSLKKLSICECSDWPIVIDSNISLTSLNISSSWPIEMDWDYYFNNVDGKTKQCSLGHLTTLVSLTVDAYRVESFPPSLEILNLSQVMYKNVSLTHLTCLQTVNVSQCDGCHFEFPTCLKNLCFAKSLSIIEDVGCLNLSDIEIFDSEGLSYQCFQKTYTRINFFGFGGNNVTITIDVDGGDPNILLYSENGKVKLPVFHLNDAIKGVVSFECKEKKCEYNAIKMVFSGEVDNIINKTSNEFIHQHIDIAGPGVLREGTISFPFHLEM